MPKQFSTQLSSLRRLEAKDWPKGHTRCISGQVFLLVFGSDYRPMTHQLATIQESDQPTNYQPTTSQHGLS